jgi:hypothetical protein
VCGTFAINFLLTLDLSEPEKAGHWVAVQLQTDRAFHWSNAKEAFHVCIE